jgi:membrane protein implicated in regulation of membrane protease activity
MTRHEIAYLLIAALAVALVAVLRRWRRRRQSERDFRRGKYWP